ncbi:MAG: hypothetical protein ACK56W_15185 [Pirellula sp.]|nr:hypothetical protein [Pirellula sp.]
MKHDAAELPRLASPEFSHSSEVTTKLRPSDNQYSDNSSIQSRIITIFCPLSFFSAIVLLVHNGAGATHNNTLLSGVERLPRPYHVILVGITLQ